MTIQRSFMSILSDRLPDTRDFYVELFGWQVSFESDWFIHLQAPGNTKVELGILRRDHDIVPPELKRSLAPSEVTSAKGGQMLVIVVENVDILYASCQKKGISIVEPPRDLFYGQRRMLIRDPNGVVIDVSSECPPSAEFLAQQKA